jgi:hypothetical protein
MYHSRQSIVIEVRRAPRYETIIFTAFGSIANLPAGHWWLSLSHFRVAPSTMSRRCKTLLSWAQSYIRPFYRKGSNRQRGMATEISKEGGSANPASLPSRVTRMIESRRPSEGDGHNGLRNQRHAPSSRNRSPARSGPQFARTTFSTSARAGAPTEPHQSGAAHRARFASRKSRTGAANRSPLSCRFCQCCNRSSTRRPRVS